MTQMYEGPRQCGVTEMPQKQICFCCRLSYISNEIIKFFFLLFQEVCLGSLVFQISNDFSFCKRLHSRVCLHSQKWLFHAKGKFQMEVTRQYRPALNPLLLSNIPLSVSLYCLWWMSLRHQLARWWVYLSGFLILYDNSHWSLGMIPSFPWPESTLPDIPQVLIWVQRGPCCAMSRSVHTHNWLR